MSRFSDLTHDLEKHCLWVATWSPGDGMTRYRFFDKPGNSYFGPGSGIYTAAGIAEAETFVTGWVLGRASGKKCAAMQQIADA